MTRNFAGKFSRTLVVLSCLALLVTSSLSFVGVRAQDCTEVTATKDNVPPDIDAPEDHSVDLGTLADGDCRKVVRQGVKDNDPGTFIDEAEIECGIQGDSYEIGIKFKLETPLCVSVETDFSGNSDVDLIFLPDFTDENRSDDFPQGFKIFRGSLNGTGVKEKVKSVLLPAGSYHVVLSNYTDSPMADITVIIRASSQGPCEVFPARYENVTFRDGPSEADAWACGNSDITTLSASQRDNFAMATRITPLSYPATLTAVRLNYPIITQNSPSPQPINILVYTDPTGEGTGPSGDPMVNESANLSTNTILIETFQLPNPITITQGDFYVGVFAQGSSNGRAPIFYTSIPDYKLTYISTDGIKTWSGPIIFRTSGGEEIIANGYVGGVITNGGAPALANPQSKVRPNRVSQTVVLPAERLERPPFLLVEK
ncbi:MAG: hypothetical protein HY314_01250 [Acidobacteria bacterium]|nr:hypothetical protein [Acidobacteriota bacterium]